MTVFDDIKTFIERLERDSKAIREEMLRICWFMRGSITYDDAMLLSEQDRELINKIINDNMETTKKSGLPFF